jgi:hypothetical protein
MSTGREKRARKALARRATRRALRKAKRGGGTIEDARKLMPKELRKLTERAQATREQPL